MLTSEAAIKAIIESVIKKSQSSLELEEQITTGPGENISDTDPDLTKGINLQDTGSAQIDLEEDFNSGLGANNAEKEPSGRRTGEKNPNMGNLEKGGKGRICKDEKKKTRIQVDISIFISMLI